MTPAIGIAAFSLVALLGLLPVALNNNKSSSEQTAAAGILATLVTNLRCVQLNNADGGIVCPIYRINMPIVPANPNYGATLYLHDDGTPADAPNKAADPSTHPRYRLSVLMHPPATGSGTDARQATVVHLTIMWPAIAEANNFTLPLNYAHSLEVVTTLDRN